MTLIGLISDVHASPEPLAEALEIFNKAGVEHIFCAGDIAGYMDKLEQTVQLLETANCRCIMGNHDEYYLEQQIDSKETLYISNLPYFIKDKIEDRQIYMVHAQPPDACHGGIKLRNSEGLVEKQRISYWQQQLGDFEHDVLIVGHTHQVFAEMIGQTLVINPGSTVFNHSCAILRLPDMSVQMFPLSGKAITMTWNWGQHVIYGQ